jgi:hypothetical protein
MPEMNGLDMLLKTTRALRGRRKTCLDVAKLRGARQACQKSLSMPDLLSAVPYELEHESYDERFWYNRRMPDSGET